MALQVISILSVSSDSLGVDSKQQPTEHAHKHVTSKGTSAPQSTANTYPPLNKYFRLFLVELLKLFDTDRPLLEKKGSFIVRCVFSKATG